MKVFAGFSDVFGQFILPFKFNVIEVSCEILDIDLPRLMGALLRCGWRGGVRWRRCCDVMGE